MVINESSVKEIIVGDPFKLEAVNAEVNMKEQAHVSLTALDICEC